MMKAEASEQAPLYTKFPQERPNPEGTQLWGISCDQGWCESIVCTGMYEWTADWLLAVLDRTPFGKSNSVGVPAIRETQGGE